MFDNFIINVNTAYNLILQPLDIIYKKKQLDIIKRECGMDESQDYRGVFSDYIKLNRKHGVVYTPKEIADYIIEGTISEEDIIRNPFLRIIDPACGAGNLIIPCFNYLKKLYKNNLELINKRHNLNLKEEDINRHIIYNNLYGADIDELSIKILSIDLFAESGYICTQNIYVCDFLIQNEFAKKFDIFIGNPPYIGHKAVDREYSLLLKKKYCGIYKDKGDISYCFFKRAMELAFEDGKISFITSRYFMESPSGTELRRIIKQNSHIIKIFDFYGMRPFKEAGIDPVIIFMQCGDSKGKTEVIRLGKGHTGSSNQDLAKILQSKNDKSNIFTIDSQHLKDNGWILLNEFEKGILDKIESKCRVTLEKICVSNQGIITGCDEAFIVTKDALEAEKLEQDIIKPWIKGRDIDRYTVNKPSKYIIYSNLIDKEENYQRIISHILPYKERLLARRECRTGLRKWYELQWGRKKELFEGTKIIFPYKASNNRFALDNGSFFSADIYSMKIIDEEHVEYAALLKLLNSSIYEFYFKTFGKKLGDSMYEYYPNTVMRLKVPDMKIFKYINIDEDILFDYFELDDKERAYIENVRI